MKIFIAGIAGTFMGSLAQMLKAAGDEVVGCDKAVYPPMSDALTRAGIEVLQGYEPAHLDCNPDLVLIGNALSRGNPLVEAVLSRGLAYESGPKYLQERVLNNKTVIAVTGTHGKTTTTSMLAWILECAGHNPSYLIGGVPHNFDVSCRLTDSKYFVIEGDEYDTAYFDKRPKMLVYQPDHIIINHLEFDHADIYEDFNQIKKQFHYLVRLIAPNKHIVAADTETVREVLERGCWSDKTLVRPPQLYANGFNLGLDEYSWQLMGQHMANNAAAAVTMAQKLGVSADDCIKAISSFKSVKRRLELVASKNGTDYYDDFAHHPTAIQGTLEALKSKYKTVEAICDLRSNSMRMGVHKQALTEVFKHFDKLTVLADANLDWSVKDCLPKGARVVDSPSALKFASSLACFVVMSNGSLSKDYHLALEG